MAPPALELLVRRDAGGYTLQVVDRGRAFLALRPRRRPALLVAVDGAFVLRSTATTAFLRLDEAEADLWQRIDGERTVEELATGWFLGHGRCSVDRLVGLLSVLRQHGFLELRRGALPFSSREAPPWYDGEWRWSGIDRWARTGASVLGPLLRREFVPLGASLVALGVTAAVLGPAWPRPSPSWAAAMAAALVGNVIVHELAHAVMTARYGRRVRALGLSWRGAFVDTTEMFTATRAQHAAVALAGPAANVLVAALVAVARLGCGEDLGWALGVLGQAAVILAVATGVPWTPRTDGARGWGAWRGG